MGNDAYVRAASTVRVEVESKLWERIGWVPDVQCAWQILLQCAGPRCHHWMRTVPPQQSALYAASHDSRCGRQWRPCGQDAWEHDTTGDGA